MSDQLNKSVLMYAKIFEHGFVELVDVMGSDETIVMTARTSYDKGTKQISNTESLIRHLMRNQHMSPFEFGELIFRIRCPIFVARQWFRHRTGSYNEISLRYSEARDECYVPEKQLITTQDSKNKQARTNKELDNSHEIQQKLKEDANLLLTHYHSYLDQGMAREIARINLPLSIYTTFMYKTDLRNLLNFLKLRFDTHAQYEIRQYAIQMLPMVEKYFPITVKAWRDFTKEAVTFSRVEKPFLKAILQLIPNRDENLMKILENVQLGTLSQTERNEFLDKIQNLFSE